MKKYAILKLNYFNVYFYQKNMFATNVNHKKFVKNLEKGTYRESYLLDGAICTINYQAYHEFQVAILYPYERSFFWPFLRLQYGYLEFTMEIINLKIII